MHRVNRVEDAHPRLDQTVTKGNVRLSVSDRKGQNSGREIFGRREDPLLARTDVVDTSEFPAGNITYSSPTNKMFRFATFVSPRTLRNESEDTINISLKRKHITAVARTKPKHLCFAMHPQLSIVRKLQQSSFGDIHQGNGENLRGSRFSAV
jgi:hypothetical protein